MTSNQIRDFCMSLPGTTEQIQWGKDLVYKIGGKLYLVLHMVPGGCYTLKCRNEEAFRELAELPGIRPAPYLARAMWVQIDPSECRLGSKEIETLIRTSYELVLAKLPKKLQQSLQAFKAAKKKSRASRTDSFKK